MTGAQHRLKVGSGVFLFFWTDQSNYEQKKAVSLRTSDSVRCYQLGCSAEHRLSDTGIAQAAVLVEQ